MTQQQTERDDTLIAEKKRLADILEAIMRLGTVSPWHDDLRKAAALLRGDEPAKPVNPAKDLLNELASTFGGFDAKYPVAKRYLDEAEARGRAQIAAVVSEYCTPPLAKPDRYVEITRELGAIFYFARGNVADGFRSGMYDNDKNFQAAVAVLRSRFEAPSEVVEAAKWVRKTYSMGTKSYVHILADFILKGDV